LNALTSNIGKNEVLVTSPFFRSVSPVPDKSVQSQHSLTESPLESSIVPWKYYYKQETERML